uniref:ABC transporter domain-containing protein n=1 Tax=Panagrolaimus sp. ES5 TaxID=591445 RepID=A0AC34FVZ7_9BILA
MSSEKRPSNSNDVSISATTAKQKGAKTVGFSERTEKTQSESKSKMLVSAEEKTTIVPDMPETNVTTGKSPKVLVFKDLFVSVPMIEKRSFVERLQFWKKRETIRREVLHGVSGVAEPGEILAIMGARNLKSLEINGEITVNGESLTLGEFQRMSSYVQQADIFMGAVTVREHLIFSARLRMGRRFSDAEKIARVDEVIIQMNLVKCQNTLIGQRHEKSISLGEKKRLAFACEVLTDPSILFCDEPTSGLDAFMAKQVVKALQDLAKEGKTIVLTIHQPSSQIFNMFNKLCLMALGEIVFLGPPKKAAGIFKQAGYPMCGRDNPAEFCIEKLASHEGESEADRRDRVLKIKSTYDDSNMGGLYQNRIYGSVSERRKKLGNQDVRESNKYAAGWFTQVLWLFVRSFRATLRDPLLLKVRLAQTLMTAIVVGVVYWNVGKPERDTVLTINGFLFNCVRDCIFMLIFPCLTVFTDEMPVFLRENHGNIYRTDAYFIGKNLAELPQYLILPIIYSLIVFFMAHIHIYDGVYNAGQFFVFLAVNTLVTNLAVSIGYAAACIFGTTEIATQVLPLITMPIMCFGGFFVNLKRISPALRFMQHLSWHRYAFEIQMINKWQPEKDATIEHCPSPISNTTTLLEDIEKLDNNHRPCDWGNNGTAILDFFKFGNESNDMIKNFAVLLFMIILFRTVAVSALFIRARLIR